MNNPFKVHNINYLSPSSINTYISDMPMWVARYLFGVKSGSGAGAIRGTVEEAVLANKYTTGKFDFNLLEIQFMDMCTKSKIDLNNPKVAKEKTLLRKFGEVIDKNFKYKNLEQYQEKVEVLFDDMPIPVMGYIDFRFKDKIVDLKTSTRMPSKPTEAQKRQMAFYSMAYPDNSIDLNDHDGAFVIKPTNGGSSVGVQIIREGNQGQIINSNNFDIIRHFFYK